MATPPPVPNLDRLTTYDPVASAGPFPVGFTLYDASGADLLVELDGVEQIGNWSLTVTASPDAPNTWVNGSIMFTAPITGALVIEGDRDPRRPAQYQEGRGVPARDSNTEWNVLTALAREMKQRLGRAVLASRGEPGFLAPPAAGRASKIWGWDADGKPVAYRPDALSPGLINPYWADLVAATDTSAGVRNELGLGSAAVADVGLAAGNVLQLNVSARLPAVDASQSLVTIPATGGVARPLLSRFYQMIAPEDFGAAGDGVTDDRNAVANWLAELMDYSGGRFTGIAMPGQVYRIGSALPDLTKRITILGPGCSGISFVRDFVGTTGKGLFHLTGDAGGDASTSKISGFGVASSTGSSGGALISVASTSTAALSAIVFEDLWLTTQGTDTHANTIYIDGTAKTTGAVGARDLSVRNVHVFGAAGYSAVFLGAVGFDWKGGGFYPAGGTGVGSGAIQLNGIVGVETQQVMMTTSTCAGLTVVNAKNCEIHCPIIGAVSGVSVNNAASAVNIMVYGNPSGTVLGNWTNSAIKRPGTAAFSAT